MLDTGANCLNASSRQLPVLLLGVFFSPVIVGFYSVGRRMLGIPVQLVTNAIAQVFFPKAVLENNDGDLAVFAGSVLRRLAIAGIAPMVMGMVIMQDIVRIFLGATWLDSVIYVQWLTLYVAMIFVTAPFSQLFSVLERQRERLVYISVLGALQAAVLVYGGQQQDPVLAVALFSIISAVGTLLNYLWLLSCAGVSVGFSMRVLAKELIWTGVFAGALVLVKSQQLSSPIVLAISAGLLSLYFRLRYRQLMGGKTPRVGNV